MVLFYGHGGGWGHLTRISRFIEWQGINEFRVITANPQASRFFSPEELILIDPELAKHKDEYDDLLRDIFNTLDYKSVVIDTFPMGILGELNQQIVPENSSLILLCRRLKWGAYIPKLGEKNINYDRVYILEELEPDHLNFLKAHSKEQLFLELPYPPKQGELSWKNPYCLIVHSGSEEELTILCELAKKSRSRKKNKVDILLFTDKNFYFEEVILMRNQQAAPWFKQAKKIYSGAGFNCLAETKNFREKQVIVPFKRKYDDQGWRRSNVLHLMNNKQHNK